MKEIKTQNELDNLKEVKSGERVTITKALRLNSTLHVYGYLEIKANLDCNRYENRGVMLWENSSAVLWGNSSAELWGNSSAELWGNSSAVLREKSSVVLRENSSAELRENSSAVLRGNSSAELWGNSSAELWGKSSVVLRENSSAVLWENSSAVAWGNALVRALSASLTLVLHGFSILSMPFDLKLKFKRDKGVAVQKFKLLPYLEREGVLIKRNRVILYKKVSKDFKTQKDTKNETLWPVGSTLTHPEWQPEGHECGPGKYHACSRPYFCDEFRNYTGDRYIAIKIAVTDLHEWTDNPTFPHKIGFRKGEVLYECDRFGKEKKA